MKKQLHIILAVLFSGILLSNCTGVKTVARGLENEAFLEFVGNPSNYSEGIDVIIDDNISFKAKVKKNHATRPKGEVYSISTGTHSTGTHTVTVSHKNKIIYQQKIFVSSQETKRIVLP